MGQVMAYTAKLLRAYVRDRTALFFGFFFPLIFMLLFGVLNLGSTTRVSLAVADEADNADSRRFVQALSAIETLRLSAGARAELAAKLEAGERDMVLVIPADFRLAPARAGASVPRVALLTSSARPEQAAIGSAILTQVIDQISFAITQTAPLIAIERREVSGRDLRYVDFLTPGILGMTIMQSGIASVAFPFVVQRQRGVIRRIMATPIPRRSFMAAHVLERLVTLVAQVLILLGVAILAFQFAVVGSLAGLLAIAILGALVFLCLGFAVTGVVATENAVPAVMQIVTLPQMFLSGVFFSREAVPVFLRPIADYLPLTFLNDALRSVSTQGASIDRIAPQLLGLAVWTLVSFVLAFRFFRLEA